MTEKYFLYIWSYSLKNYIQHLWSEMAVSSIISNLQTHEYNLYKRLPLNISGKHDQVLLFSFYFLFI